MIKRFITILWLVGFLSTPLLAFAWQCTATDYYGNASWYGQDGYQDNARNQALIACEDSASDPGSCYIVSCNQGRVLYGVGVPGFFWGGRYHYGHEHGHGDRGEYRGGGHGGDRHGGGGHGGGHGGGGHHGDRHRH